MALLDAIKNAGVVGAGGAGFPTHVKLDCQVEFLLINAAECEPLLQTDKFIIKAYAGKIVRAASVVAEHVSAKTTYIAIKNVNQELVEHMQEAISQTGDSGISVFGLDNYYPAGDEQMLVYDITSRVVPPSGIPLEVGVVVSNVATMLSIHDAINGIPVTHKFLTVAGEVARTKVLRVPIGISFRECIDACGGACSERFSVIDGGPMMGKVYDGSYIEKMLVTKTTSGAIVIPGTGNLAVKLANTSMQKVLNRAKAACIQCSFCTDLCPRNLIGHKLRPHMIMRQMAAMDFAAPIKDNPVFEEALICCECGICETFACPMNLSPRQVNKHIKKILLGTNYNKPDKACVATSLREYRKIAPVKIMSRMGLASLYRHETAEYQEIETDVVRIPLKQHIGAPAKSVVAVGDIVTPGQLIASAEGKVSANIHASIAGEVTDIGEIIEIRAK